MVDLFKDALNKIDIAVIIINNRQEIVFWNKYNEEISKVSSSDALHKKITEIVPVFEKTIYQNIFVNVFTKNQSRFCSSKIHKGFIFPEDKEQSEVRQNMKIEPIFFDNEVYAFIQIEDISDQVMKEGKLISLINELQKGFVEIKKAEEMNKQLAELDALTGVLNRRAITQRLDALIQNTKECQKCSLLFLDLDKFKCVNDHFGHLVGDKLLIYITEVLKANVGEEDIIARLGGDEFIILLYTTDGLEQASAIANKLVCSISKHIIIDKCNIDITVSVGVFMFDPFVKSSSEIIKKADMAMYEAKRQGKNRINVYANVD